MQGKDITGQKFGYWTVLGRDYDYHSPKHAKWICRCECGTVKSSSFFNGTKTCELLLC